MTKEVFDKTVHDIIKHAYDNDKSKEPQVREKLAAALNVKEDLLISTEKHQPFGCALLYKENSDDSCESNVRFFRDIDAARKAMLADYQSLQKEYLETEKTADGEPCVDKDLNSISVHEGYDDFVWSIEPIDYEDEPRPNILISGNKEYIGVIQNANLGPCRMAGCTGRRYSVKWDNGKRTYPCSKGVTWLTNNIACIGYSPVFE